jgi:hypothetical protein
MVLPLRSASDKGAMREEMAMSAAEGWARDFFSRLFVELWLGAIQELRKHLFGEQKRGSAESRSPSMVAFLNITR